MVPTIILVLTYYIEHSKTQTTVNNFPLELDLEIYIYIYIYTFNSTFHNTSTVGRFSLAPFRPVHICMLQEQPEEEPEPTPSTLLELPDALLEKVAICIPDPDWGSLSSTCKAWNNLLSLESEMKAWQQSFPDLADWSRIPFQ